MAEGKLLNAVMRFAFHPASAWAEAGVHSLSPPPDKASHGARGVGMRTVSPGVPTSAA